MPADIATSLREIYEVTPKVTLVDMPEILVTIESDQDCWVYMSDECRRVDFMARKGSILLLHSRWGVIEVKYPSEHMARDTLDRYWSALGIW